MAQEFDDGRFWLPPEFLDDEDILKDLSPVKPVAAATNGDVYERGFFGHGFGSYGPKSDLSSPVESVIGSTETESDEEDFLGGLTRKIAHSALEEDFYKSKGKFSFQNSLSKGGKQSTRVFVRSPQSTQCGCKQRGSPNCLSPQAVVPPPLNRSEASWDLLFYAAEGEVVRMRTADEADAQYYNPRKTHENSNLHYQQLQAVQFQLLKQKQIMIQQQQQYLQMIEKNMTRNGVALPLSSKPNMHLSQHQQLQPRRSGMQAVFLGNPNPKRECTGTGVFLPRQIGAPIEPRKKRGCSTVLLPDRVVQALNLNLEPQSKRNTGPFPIEFDLRHQNKVTQAHKMRNNGSQSVGINEVRLPQEWTY